MYPENVMRQKLQELEEKYKKKIRESNSQINKIRTEYSELERICDNQKKQIAQLSQKLNEEKALNGELSEKINKTFGARLRRLFGLKK